MRRVMPTSLIAAETAIGVLVVCLMVVLALNIRWGTSSTVTVLHLAWTITAVIGIPFRCRLAWRLACAASALLGLIAVLGTVMSLFLTLMGHDDFFFDTIWPSCCAVYVFAVYYLLRRPIAVNYFKDKGGEDKGVGSH
jgi:hypothetical protein